MNSHVNIVKKNLLENQLISDTIVKKRKDMILEIWHGQK